MKSPIVALVLASAASIATPVFAAADGAALFADHCAACHDRGAEHPGTARLADRYPDEASLLDRKQLPKEFVRHIVRHGFNLMPAFRPGELSNAELDALADFLAAGPHPKKEAKK